MKKVVKILLAIVTLLLSGCSIDDDVLEKSNKEETKETKEIVIILTEGELGEYGKKVQVDKYTYIFYYIPNGTYEVEIISAKIKTNYLWVESNNNWQKNDEGYTEIPVIKKLTAGQGKQVISITENEHILLTMGTIVKLTLVK